MNYDYFNNWHLGDCLWQCVFLRKAATAHPDHSFTFYCPGVYHGQLNEVIADLPNVTLKPLEQKTPGAIDCWMGTGTYNGKQYWHNHPQRNDVVVFFIDWFNRLCEQSKIEPLFRDRTDCLFEYPALHNISAPAPDFDYLVINSAPLSGQFNWNPTAMNRLIQRLSQKQRVITTNASAVTHLFCTEKQGMTVTQIGNISLRAKGIVMVANGPCWPTFNAQNLSKPRLILLNQVRIDYGVVHPHFDSTEAAEAYLQQQGLL
jgi:hypothetical protein